VLNHPGKELWYTAWRMTHKDTGETIGDLGFKGEPDDKTVEIGYGVLESYRGQGYTTEAVKALCEWVFTQENVYFVRAITQDGNAASERVLEKNKFKRIDGAGDGKPVWEKEKTASSWMAVYMCIGISVGLTFGMTVFDNSGLGMAIGIGIGLALGAALDAQDKKNRVRKSDKKDEDDVSSQKN
jgi:GNAT superfamily N-acetyltransferase